MTKEIKLNLPLAICAKCKRCEVITNTIVGFDEPLYFSARCVNEDICINCIDLFMSLTEE